MKKSVASKPCAARSLIPGGSIPVSLSSMICLFQPGLSKTKERIMVHEPQSLFLKYCRDGSSVPQDSKPVEMTPGIMMTGCFAVTPWDFAWRPTAKESYVTASRSCFYFSSIISTPFRLSGYKPWVPRTCSCCASLTKAAGRTSMRLSRLMPSRFARTDKSMKSLL